MSDWSITFEQVVQEVGLTFEYMGDAVTINVVQATSSGGGGSSNNIDGGTPDSVYLMDQLIDGGNI